MIGPALAAALLLAAAVAAPAQERPAPPPAAADEWRDAPPRFPAAAELVEALAIEDQAAHIIDAFWAPATAALIAANPDKADAARRHAAEQRAAELAIYPKIAVTMLDNDALELLNPKVAERLDALLERRRADYARTRDLSEGRMRVYAEEQHRITAAAAARANGDLLELARLARTPEGVALRALQRQGFFQCDFWKRRRPLSPEEKAHCGKFAASPALRRLRRSPKGERLIRVSNAVHANLVAMVAMGHAAGLSLHRLLPPEEVRAAGLAIPPDERIEILPPAQDPKP